MFAVTRGSHRWERRLLLLFTLTWFLEGGGRFGSCGERKRATVNEQSEDDYFDEPSEIDSAHSVNLNGWNDGKPQKPSSIGNWVQCREVLYSDGSDEGIVCGKWRRAPLFVVQSEDWDCSCSVLWDPFHADCAVPQELETDEVLKHLKFTKWLRSRLMDKSRNQLHLKSQLQR
ncbi:hypothetical protein C4D60_Mb01t11210 [Musa balbisiana]|uniref:CW-type domain-containing protein n=1 Tax=Musa balbisiana TaxID=52838 RepID=A0A4S8JLN9_MUSBA|nr:hypothetical protein C4D60_Mb01t11210 [Musa balbisiana]